jgi:hypothetical protein
VADAAAFLLFVLSGAFVFLYRCHYTSYLAARTEGRQLLFRVGAAASCLLLLSYALLAVGEVLLPEPIVSWTKQTWTALFSAFGVPFLYVYLGVFVLGPVLAFIANRLYDADKASTMAIRRYGTETEKLLLQAMESGALVSVTMENRKVYIGWPAYSPDLRHEASQFRILPAVSGYREEGSLELRLTTQYLDIYERIRQGQMSHLKADDFEVALPLEKVVSANLFSLDIDQDVFKLP